MTEVEQRLNLQNLSPDKREIHTQRLLVKAKKVLKVTVRLQRMIDKVVKEHNYAAIERDLKAMGTYPRLIALEKEIANEA